MGDVRIRPIRFLLPCCYCDGILLGENSCPVFWNLIEVGDPLKGEFLNLNFADNITYFYYTYLWQ